MNSLSFFKAIITLITKFFTIIIPVLIIFKVLTGAVLRAVLSTVFLFLTVLLIPGVLTAGAVIRIIIIILIGITFILKEATP